MREAPTTTGQPSAAQLVEVAEQREVVRAGLGEAEPGIDQDARPRHARRDGGVDPLGQLSRHLAHHVGITRVRVHLVPAFRAGARG